MGDVRLIITHKNPTAEPVEEQLLKKTLHNMGLIGQEIDFYGEVGYAPGDEFRELIETTLSAEEEKPKKGIFSKLYSSKPTSYPFTITLETDAEIGFDCSPEDLELVNCPHCQTEISNWEAEVDHWFQDNNYQRICPNCKVATLPYEFDFQRLGAFSRQKVNIWNIGKGYGHLTEKLLQNLEKETGSKFDYYFVRI